MLAVVSASGPIFSSLNHSIAPIYALLFSKALSVFLSWSVVVRLGLAWFHSYCHSTLWYDGKNKLIITGLVHGGYPHTGNLTLDHSLYNSENQNCEIPRSFVFLSLPPLLSPHHVLQIFKLTTQQQ